ncbi:hypothetical protein CK203_092060 [Vitis vinifera]|uniref:Uncharacterized protein n=1 Tax=Vitis vinifera TaxID=29760 RepID=A0A438CL99_VITVI|nr:hypothetical protein CK203_092060 [Vitis vinifera]
MISSDMGVADDGWLGDGMEADEGELPNIRVLFQFGNLIFFPFVTRSMKAKMLATYPDAFPDDSKSEILDQRPDLEIPS